MGTLTVQASGFAALPAQAPSDWPSGIAYPGGGSPNGTKTVTISDTDWEFLLSWAAWNYITANQGPPQGQPTTTTAPQILLALVNGWHKAMINSVQQYHTQPAVVPPPIIIS